MKNIILIIMLTLLPLTIKGQELVYQKNINTISIDSTINFIQSIITSYKLYKFKNKDYVQLVKSVETYKGVKFNVLFFGKKDIFLLYLKHSNEPKGVKKKLKKRILKFK